MNLLEKCRQLTSPNKEGFFDISMREMARALIEAEGVIRNTVGLEPFPGLEPHKASEWLKKHCGEGGGVKKWFVKQRAGTGYLKAWTRFTCVKYKDGSPDWKYHTQMLHFSQSRVDAKRFDKEKTAIKFVRTSNDLKALYDKGQIIIVEEDT